MGSVCAICDLALLCTARRGRDGGAGHEQQQPPERAADPAAPQPELAHRHPVSAPRGEPHAAAPTLLPAVLPGVLARNARCWALMFTVTWPKNGWSGSLGSQSACLICGGVVQTLSQLLMAVLKRASSGDSLFMLDGLESCGSHSLALTGFIVNEMYCP